MAARATGAIAFTLLALALAGARFVHLGADPAPSLPATFLTDEGWWCRNARQSVLFGSTPLDDFNQALYAAPVYNAAITAAFAAGGVSFAAARAVSALSSVLTLAVLGGLALVLAGRKAAAWCVFLLGLSAPYLLFNRTAMVESLLILWLALAAAASALGMKRRGWLALAGVFAALAFWTKPNAFYVCGLPVLAALSPRSRGPARPGRSLLLAALGFAAISLPAAAEIVAPHFGAWLRMNGLIAAGYARAGWASIPVGLLGFPRNALWGEAAPIAALCFGMLLWRVRSGGGGPAWTGVAGAAGRVAAWWLALGAVTTAILPNQPERRALTLLPPLCLLAALSIVRRQENGGALPRSAEAIHPASKRGGIFLLLLWPSAALVSGGWSAASVFFRGMPVRWALGAQTGHVPAVLISLAAIALAAWMARRCRTQSAYASARDALVAVAGVYPIWMGLRWLAARWVELAGVSREVLLAADGAAAILVVLTGLWALARANGRGAVRGEGAGGGKPVEWVEALLRPVPFAVIVIAANLPSLASLARPSFTIRDAGRRLERALRRDAVLVGPFADTVGMESNLKTVEVRPRFHMNEKPFERWPGAVLVTAARHELQDGESVPAWAPRDAVPVLDLPLCPNPWTGTPRFVLRLRAVGASP